MGSGRRCEAMRFLLLLMQGDELHCTVKGTVTAGTAGQTSSNPGNCRNAADIALCGLDRRSDSRAHRPRLGLRPPLDCLAQKLEGLLLRPGE